MSVTVRDLPPGLTDRAIRARFMSGSTRLGMLLVWCRHDPYRPAGCGCASELDSRLRRSLGGVWVPPMQAWP